MKASSQIPLYLVAFLLLLAPLSFICYKIFLLKMPVYAEQKSEELVIESRVSFVSKGEPVKAKLYLPNHLERYTLMSESASVGYGFQLKKTKNIWTANWSARSKSGLQRLYYRIKIPAEEAERSSFLIKEADSLEVIAPNFGNKQTVSNAAHLLANNCRELSADNKGFVTAISKTLLSSQPRDEVMILRRYYQREDEVYWHSYALRDLIRLENIPTRLGKGLLVKTGQGINKTTVVPIVEYASDDQWKIINQFELLPILNDHQLIAWRRGSQKLSKLIGGDNLKTSFTVERNEVFTSSRFDEQSFWLSTISSLPVSERAIFRYLTLIPLGILIVVFFRNFIGLPSVGTFMPVLLSLSFLEIESFQGGLMFILILWLGLFFRRKLSNMNLLIVPRVGACVVIVTILMILVTILSYRFGFSSGLQITAFPMIVLAWTIERLSVLWEEEGSSVVLKQVSATVVISSSIYFVLKVPAISFWLTSYPETLLVILALILFSGRYFGYRLTELIRFKPLVDSLKK